MSAVNLDKYYGIINKSDLFQRIGKVVQVIGLTIEASGIFPSVGEVCRIYANGSPILAEVVGFKSGKTLLMPLGELGGIAPGNKVVPTGRQHTVAVGPQLLGRVLDGLGNPLEGPALDRGCIRYPVNNLPPDPLKRSRIREPLTTGVKAIDGLVTCGMGQRVGIFAGSGVGKSILLGMIARHSTADVNVIGLIGERGREVLEFLERDLGAEGLKKSVVVVATSDQPALIRIKGALVATAIAEYFRDMGKNVMLMMDSITRLGMAQREVGLAVGEPPATKGYTPSVFAFLPKLLERAGKGKVGSITGLYTVLVEGDDLSDPIADTVRGILDGHIVLSRQLANRNHYPAVDVLQSVSRLMPEIVSSDHLELAGRLRDLLATYHQMEDLINIGAYSRGSNPRVDEAIDFYQPIISFLQQGMDEHYDLPSTMKQLKQALKR